MREMPTAAKLVGAVCFAITGWLVLDAFTPQIPDHMPDGRQREVAAFIGVLVGWFVLGRAVGRGIWQAPVTGLTNGVVLYFWVLFAFSFWEMILRSLDKEYNGPMAAVTDLVNIGLAFAKLTVHGPTLITWIGASVVSGILTELAKKYWR